MLGGRIAALWLGLGLALACASAPEPEAGAPAPAPIEAAPAPRMPLVVGIDAVRLDDAGRTAELARALAPAGALAAKPWCRQVEWGAMQPEPGAAIDFERLDAFVSSFQAAGFRELMVCLDSTSAWASPAAWGRLDPPSPAPRPEHLPAFERWVGAIVERYDADGVDDLPGLRAPVRLFEVGSELSGAAHESIPAYLLMLEHAYRAAHEASPDVVIAHAAFLTTGALPAEPGGGPQRWDTAFARMSPRIAPRPLAALRAVLDRPDLFDALNVHALADAAELEALVGWLRWEVTQRGYSKPILVSEASAPPLVARGPATRCEGPADALGLMVAPAVEGDRCRLAEHFRKLLRGDAEAVAWTRRHAAEELVKKVVVAAERRVWWINTALAEDPSWWKDPALQAAAGAAPWSGLVDLARHERRPSFHALQQVMAALSDRSAVRRLSQGRREVRVYALEGAAGPVWVAWFDPGLVVLPGEPAPAAVVSIETGSARVRVESTALRETLSSRLVDTDDGVAWLEVSTTPVFVRPEP